MIKRVLFFALVIFPIMACNGNTKKTVETGNAETNQQSTQTPSAEAIKASRDHRAFSGYSRGAVMTWRMLHYGFEYFKYFAPMSCMTRHTSGSVFSRAISKGYLPVVKLL